MKFWTKLDWEKVTENFLNESYIKNMYSDEDLNHHFNCVQPYFYNGQVMHTFMGYLCGLNKIYLGSSENEPQKTASD